MRFFRQFQHLLPRSEAWRITLDKQLRNWFLGLSDTQKDAVEFVDLVYLDLFPDTTRELEQWEKFFNLAGTGTEAQRRSVLDARWKAQGGQDPDYLQTTVQNAGFPLFVHEWWPGDGSVTVGNLDPAGREFLLDYATQPVTPRCLRWRPDGYVFWVLDRDLDTLYTYRPTNRWRVDGALLVGQTTLNSPGSEVAQHFGFNNDGTELFVLTREAGVSNDIRKYALAEAYELPTTLPASSQTLDISVQTSNASFDFEFSPAGTRLVVMGASDLFQYNLSSAYDLSAATYQTNRNLGVSLTGIVFIWDGEALLFQESGSDQIAQLDCATPYDVITGATVNANSYVDPTRTFAQGIANGRDDKRIYVVGAPGDPFPQKLVEYTLPARAKDPRNYVDQVLIGRTQCGDTKAECGEEPPDQRSTDSALCDNSLANVVGYLVNSNLTSTAPPGIPEDPEKWPYFLYFGGATFPDRVNIDKTKQVELERLLLTICPTQQWLALLVDYIETTGEEQVRQTLASNQLVQTDQVEVVIGGGYINGSTGNTLTWEILGTLIDGGAGVPTDCDIRLYDMGADGAPTSGTLRSTLTLSSVGQLDRVSQTLTASASPGVGVNEIQNAERMYEVRAFLNATGNVHSCSVLSAEFVDTP